MRVVLALALGMALAGAVRAADAAQDEEKAKKAQETIKQSVEALKGITAILNGIKDDASADAVLTKLGTAAKNLRELDKKLRDFKLSPEAEKKLREDNKQEIEQVKNDLLTAAVQAGSKAPKKAAAIQAALQATGG